jgi:iron(III) transport system permease protein
MVASTVTPRRRRLNRHSFLRSLPWIVLGVGIVAAFVVPFITLIVMAFRTTIPGLGGEWTMNGMTEAYTGGGLWGPLFQSLIFAVASSIGGTALGLYFVFVSTRTKVFTRRVVTPMMVVILATPSLFFALSWSMLGADRVGLINTVYSNLTGSEESVFSIHSWPGLILVMSIKLSAFCYFLMLGPSLQMSRALEEAAEVSGSGPAGSFFRIYLPLLSPSIVGSLLIGFIVGLQAFDMPQIIGVQAGIEVLSTEIFAHVNNFPANYAAAASIALGLVLVLGFLVWAQMTLLRSRDFTTVAGKSSPTTPWALPKIGWLVNLSVVVFGLLAFVLPTVQLVMSSFSTVFGRYDSWSTRNYEILFDNPATMDAIRNTVQFVIVGGFVTVLLGSIMTSALRSRPTRAKRWLEAPTWIPWATPGLVGTLALLGTLLAIPALHSIYGTTTAMLIALVIASLPVAMRFTENAVLQIDRQLIDAARISGADSTRAFGTILLPLIAPSFLAGWFVTGLAIAGNLEVPLLLGTVQQTTIAGLAYKFHADSFAPLAAALFCILLVTVVALFVVAMVLRWAISKYLNRPRKGRRSGVVAAATPAVVDPGPPAGAIDEIRVDTPEEQRTPALVAADVTASPVLHRH